MRKYTFISLFSVFVFSGIIFFISRNTARAIAQTPLAITASDVSQAGYTKVEVQGPDGVNYQPALYFWVDDTAGTRGGDQLLMISVYNQGSPYSGKLFQYGTNTRSFDISGGVGQEATPDQDPGRIAINFSKGNYYVVIIGPEQKQIEALAQIIAGKI